MDIWNPSIEEDLELNGPSPSFITHKLVVRIARLFFLNCRNKEDTLWKQTVTIPAKKLK
jgi:hypothetical protein